MPLGLPQPDRNLYLSAMQRLMSILVLLLALPMLIYSCNTPTGTESDLIGKWVVDEVVDSLSTYSESERANLHRWLYGKRWQFSAAHTYVESDQIDSIGFRGNWSYDPESGTIALFDSIALDAQARVLFFFPANDDSTARMLMPLPSGESITLLLKHSES